VSTDLVIRKGADVLVDLLPELEDSCDLILLLAAMPLPATVELVGHFPQIDIAIAADNRQGNVAPFLSATSLLTQTGNRGRYQGVLSVSWNGKPWSNNTTSSLTDLKKRLESVNLQLHRLQNNQGAPVFQKDKIAQLKNSRAELSEQIMRLEEAQKTETGSSYVSTYKHHFLPLKNTGRVDPQIDSIIRDTKKQMAIADKK
jgi:2',3'-cyclic-nucleotide 2'-phosphodiesterase (5'-nucleotidase family)